MRTAIFAAIFAALLTFAAGCGLSPQQRKAYDTALKNKAALVEKIKTIEGRLLAYKADAAAVAAKIKAKEIPWQEAAPLIARLTDSFAADKAALTEARDAIRTVGADIEALRDLKVPWYYYVGPVVTGLLGVFGGYLPGARKAGAARAVLGAVVRGVERAGAASAEVKKSIRDESEKSGLAGAVHGVVRDLVG